MSGYMSQQSACQELGCHTAPVVVHAARHAGLWEAPGHVVHGRDRKHPTVGTALLQPEWHPRPGPLATLVAVHRRVILAPPHQARGYPGRHKSQRVIRVAVTPLWVEDPQYPVDRAKVDGYEHSVVGLTVQLPRPAVHRVIAVRQLIVPYHRGEHERVKEVEARRPFLQPRRILLPLPQQKNVSVDGLVLKHPRRRRPS